MTTSPLISIIIPTYNRANYIAETIESIRQQTYANWELIIVDDGSDDDTSEIVRAIPDKRIRFFKGPHSGMEKARNEGLEKANGELIGFMDSDDLWSPDKLEKQLSVFREHPQIAFCLTGGYEFKKNGEPSVYFYKQREGLKHGNLFLAFFQSEVVALPASLLFKKTCLDVTGFFKKLELAHIHFILSLAIHFEGAIVYEPLLYRRMHDRSYSHVHRIKRHYDGLEMIKQYRRQLPRKVFIDSLFKSHINFGEVCLNKAERWMAMHEFFQAWKYKPLSIVPVKKLMKAVLPVHSN